MRRTLITLLLSSLLSLPALAAPVDSIKAELAANLVSVEANRKQAVAANLGLSDSEAQAFWPLYQNYREQISALAHEGLGTLVDYAVLHNQQSLTQVDAANILDDVLKREAQRSVLKEHFIQQLAREISPRIALRFLLVEGQMDALSRYDALRQIPLD